MTACTAINSQARVQTHQRTSFDDQCVVQITTCTSDKTIQHRKTAYNNFMIGKALKVKPSLPILVTKRWARSWSRCAGHCGTCSQPAGDYKAPSTPATMSPVLATMSNEISSLRQCRNKLNTFNLLRLCRTNEQQIAVECPFTYLPRCHSS